MLLFDKQKIKNRWAEYVEELYLDQRHTNFATKGNEYRPSKITEKK